MAEKALVLGFTGLEKATVGGNAGWKLYYKATITDVSITVPPLYRTVDHFVFSTTLNPLLAGWRSKIAEDVEAEALAQHTLTVDSVTFPDFGVVGLPLL